MGQLLEPPCAGSQGSRPHVFRNYTRGVEKLLELELYSPKEREVYTREIYICIYIALGSPPIRKEKEKTGKGKGVAVAIPAAAEVAYLCRRRGWHGSVSCALVLETLMDIYIYIYVFLGPRAF